LTAGSSVLPSGHVKRKAAKEKKKISKIQNEFLIGNKYQESRN
jgi:hypothetical protein